MVEEEFVLREEGIHGERWRTIHDGYFADPEVAACFLDILEKVIDDSRPAVIADLGGGTGFILTELERRSKFNGIKLIDVDISPRQLSSCNDMIIDLLQESVSKFTRQQLQVGDGKLLLIARSLLHYFGASGMRRLLRHIRHQLNDGEFFIHQSACFQHLEDAQCLNLVYELMRTNKWYPTVDKMKEIFEEEGWTICFSIPAPMIHLSSQDLTERYELTPNDVEKIRNDAQKRYGQKPNVFTTDEIGFEAWLHYYIFVCRASPL